MEATRNVNGLKRINQMMLFLVTVGYIVVGVLFRLVSVYGGIYWLSVILSCINFAFNGAPEDLKQKIIQYRYMSVYLLSAAMFVLGIVVI